MPAQPNLFLAIAAANGFLAVALGAFGAHGLKTRLSPDLMAVWHTAVQYHFWHTLALFGVALYMFQNNSSKILVSSGWLFTAGILIFSGSLYAMCLTGQRWLGAVTPIGGTLWLLAWGFLCYSSIKQA